LRKEISLYKLRYLITSMSNVALTVDRSHGLHSVNKSAVYLWQVATESKPTLT